MFNNNLGGYYGTEDIKTEFKTFCLKEIYSLSLADAENILTNLVWEKKLSYEINGTIKKYLKKVLPKYISSFSNSDINGDFIIGIDDFGEITGIPIYGEIDKEMIEKKLKEVIITNIRIDNEKLTDDSAEKILDNIELEYIPLDIDPNLVTDEYSERYNEYKRQFMYRNNKIMEYNQKRIQWLGELSKYSTKLTTLINSTETREDIIQYIRNKSDNNEKQLQIIEMLKTDEYVPIPKYEVLIVRKIDPNDVLYWLVKYKDDMTELTCLKRPIKPSFSKVYTPLQIIQKMSLVRHIFMNIEEVTYYMLKISIKGENIPGEVYYKDAGEWKIRYRRCSEDGPYSE